jgi:tetratricopeptide (TPR) repeat protein
MSSPLPPEALTALREAEGWLELGNFNEAAEAVEMVAFNLRNHPSVLLFRSQLYFAAGQPEVVIDLTAALLAVEPEHPASWFERARALVKLGRLPEARAALVKCIEHGGSPWKLNVLDSPDLAVFWE